MDSKTTLEDIKKWARKVRNDRDWHPDARSLAISIVLEAGEILEHFQWDESASVEEKLKLSRKKIKKGKKLCSAYLFMECPQQQQCHHLHCEPLRRFWAQYSEFFYKKAPHYQGAFSIFGHQTKPKP